MVSALFKHILIVSLLLPFLPSPAFIPPAKEKRAIGKADLIRIDKSERQLLLLRDGKTIATYAIALGRNPVGDKEKQGDMRTPEGRFRIDWRNPKSGYHLSLHISYPDKSDLVRAAAAGIDPGGDIMIHGQPNGYGMPASLLLQQVDWTYGCIAVSNADMDEIWKAVPDGTPIEISP